MSPLQNLIVIGGSYVGVNTAQQLANAFTDRFRVILLEKNSHFQHLFAFPRFAVTSAVDTHKSFIPYSGAFVNCPANTGSVIQASVVGVDKSAVHLDRNVSLDGEFVNQIPYAFLVIATGTKLAAPSTLPGSEKADGVNYLRKHAQKTIRASKIAVIGGGAVGVQIATDLKELYPQKSVTVIHSRQQLMSHFHPKFSEIVKQRFQELGISTKLGSRVKLPPSAGGYPTDGSTFNVELEDGSTVPADFAIVCTGQVPQSNLVKTLSPQSIDDRGFIKVFRTLQINNSLYPNIFAVGDVADTGAHKAARPGGKQAEIVVQNIQHLLEGESLETYDVTDPAAIHLTLGITKNVVFRNPVDDASDPFIKHRDDGQLDMGIDGVWTRRGGGPNPYL